MDRSKQSAADFHARIDELCNAVMLSFQRILYAVEDEPEKDYATIAQKELTMKTQQGALIQSVQDLSGLIKELKDLWLFGSLDTLTDPADEDANKEQALRVAALIEKLAKANPTEVGKVRNGESG